MVRYALDANAIAEDFLFRRNPGRLLLREARHERIELLIPEIALDEAVNLYREAAEDAARQGRRAIKRLRGLEVIPPSEHAAEWPVAEAVAAYEHRLRETLHSAGAKILPYPAIPHHAVARRALDRKRPFDPAGKDGYRDTLIWESLLEAAVSGESIILVTADNAAFSPKGSTELRDELKAELGATGLPEDAIQRIRRISDFTDQLPNVPALQLEVEHLLGTPGEARNIVVEGILEETLDYSQTETFVIGLDMKVDQLYIGAVEEVSNIRVTAARELDDREVAIELEADMKATLEVYVAKSDATAYEGDDLTVVEWDHDDDHDLVKGELRRLVWVAAEGRYDPTDQIAWARPYNFIPIGDF